MTEKKTVALLCGGRSSEHPISLITAAGVLGAIDRTAYDVITIGITRDGRWYQMCIRDRVHNPPLNSANLRYAPHRTHPP